MKTKEYQNVVITIVLLTEDCIRTSGNGDANETERIPFVSSPSNPSHFVQ